MIESRRRRQELIRDITARAVPIPHGTGDVEGVLEVIGDASTVLLGEATHGTHEFYAMRAEITRRLIVERGFAAVAVEADWPDALRVDRFVRGRPGDLRGLDALGDFQRFPMWMWRNADVLDLAGALRAINMERVPADRVSFYGLDLYSLSASTRAVIDYLETLDPGAAAAARERYGCLDLVHRDSDLYGLESAIGRSLSCEDEVVEQLLELRTLAGRRMLETSDLADREEAFHAEMNALVARDAERYYREMYRGRSNTWNLRDEHMFETLQAIHAHLERTGRPVKVVVWAHNSHIGDARATEMGDRGELNLGQLVRKELGDQARLIGFTTHHGTVSAASEWDGPVERKWVRPALLESHESVFHETRIGNFVLDLRGVDEELWEERLERAIGVLYLPQSERASHYFYARIQRQLDAVTHLDATRAVEPIDASSLWDHERVGETYPSGL